MTSYTRVVEQICWEWENRLMTIYYKFIIYQSLWFYYVWWAGWKIWSLTLALLLIGWRSTCRKLQVSITWLIWIFFYIIISLCLYRLINYVFFVACLSIQKDCFEIYALVPGLLREEVTDIYLLLKQYTSVRYSDCNF